MCLLFHESNVQYKLLEEPLLWYQAYFKNYKDILDAVERHAADQLRTIQEWLFSSL